MWMRTQTAPMFRKNERREEPVPASKHGEVYHRFVVAVPRPRLGLRPKITENETKAPNPTEGSPIKIIIHHHPFLIITTTQKPFRISCTHHSQPSHHRRRSVAPLERHVGRNSRHRRRKASGVTAYHRRLSRTLYLCLGASSIPGNRHLLRQHSPPQLSRPCEGSSRL